MRLILLFLICLVLVSCAAQPVNRSANGESGTFAKNKEAAELNIELGASYIASGDYQAADDKLLKAFQQDPDSSVARWTYAILQEQLRPPNVAEEYYKQALSINPNDSRGQNAYASFLCRHSRYQEADKHFKNALSNPLYKAREATNLNAGVCAMEIPDFDTANIYFEEVIRIKPSNRVALYQLAKLHFLKNDFATSQSYMRDFEEVSKHSAESLWLAYRTERGLGNTRIAQSYAKLLTNKFPSSQEAGKLARAN